MTTTATIEMGFDGGIDVLVGAGVDVTIPPDFLIANGLFANDLDADDYAADAVAVVDIIAALFDRKGYGYDRARLASVVKLVVMPGPGYDRADCALELTA